MALRKVSFAAGLIIASVAVLPAAAQIKPTPPSDPLARIRAAAAANSEACTVQPTSPCAQANPKIIAAAENSTTLDASLRKLLTGDIGARTSESPELAKAVAWAVDAFKAAGVDEVHTEKYQFVIPRALDGQNVVAQIRGRERPDEFVVLSSHLDSWGVGHGALDAGCNAALVIEAARAIHLTGLRPRRSIRFILFTGSEEGNFGSWAYADAHRSELDQIVSAVNFDRGAGRVDGFSLGGRPELESGVREVLKDYEKSWYINDYTGDATLDSDNFDFLLEGVPTLLANQPNVDTSYNRYRRTTGDVYEKVNLDDLKHNVAAAGVLVFGLAEREMVLGPRLSRADTGRLLERTGLDSTMRQTYLWRVWEDGSRGRQP